MLASLINISDKELIERCKKGDIKSHQLLYNRYCKAMYNTCLRLVVNAADAEDILQDAFMEAFANLYRLNNTGAFGGWLKRIVINKSLNFISRKKENWLNIDLADESIVRDDETVDEEEFHFTVEAIKKTISELDEKYRAVVSLHLFEKMSFEEIAGVMQVPSATIRSQYLRAKQKIVSTIKKEAVWKIT